MNSLFDKLLNAAGLSSRKSFKHFRSEYPVVNQSMVNKVLDLSFSNARQEGESFERYKKRRTLVNQYLKARRKGEVESPYAVEARSNIRYG